MVSLRAILGLFPKTADVEAKKADLEKEFAKLNDYVKSEELAEYSELKNTVPTSSFERKKKEIRSQSFKKTPEYIKEKEYKSLSKDSEIKNYFKVKGSAQLKSLQEFEDSAELKEYQALESFLKSDEYFSVKKYMALSSKKKFEQTDLYKNLQQYEQQKNSSLIINYRKVLKNRSFSYYKNLKGSDRITRFEELEKFINSGKVSQAKQNMSKKEFIASPEYQKLQEYNHISKTKDIKGYKNIVSLPYFNDFLKLYSSTEIEAFEELEKYILSQEFKQERKKIENSRFKDTPEYKKEERHKNLEKSSFFKSNKKFRSSKSYNDYLKTEGSEKLTRFENLKAFRQSPEFIRVKEYMNLPGKKKYELSDEYKKEQRYKELKNSDKVKWYLKIKDSKKFNDLKKWKVTFEEDFNSAELDRKKWMTKYFWGETILHDTYSLAHEKQYFSDGKNLEIKNSILKVVTRTEKATGKAWNPELGFFPKEFNYTSGLISTGNYFRQKFGIFEAKIRFNSNFPVNHSFWMISEHILPHIDIAKAQKKLEMGNIWGNVMEKNGVKKRISNLSLGKFSNDFFIYTLEWTRERLTWKINGITVTSTAEGVPQDQMYIVLSSALYTDVNGSVLPAAMEVDWVRCYQSAD